MSMFGIVAALNGTGSGENPGYAGSVYMGDGGPARAVTGVGFSSDILLSLTLSSGSSKYIFDSQRGTDRVLRTEADAAELVTSQYLVSIDAGGFTVGASGGAMNVTSILYDMECFEESAASGVDVVLASGTGIAHTIAHSLPVAPGMIWGKSRSGTRSWRVFHEDATGGASSFLALNSSGGYASSSTVWNGTLPTSSVFSVGTANETNASGEDFVYYLFAEIAGKSKITSFTTNSLGAGSVSLGFGSVGMGLLKSESTGDWILFSSAANGSMTSFSKYIALNDATPAVTLGSPFMTVSSGTASFVDLLSSNTKYLAYFTAP